MSLTKGNLKHDSDNEAENNSCIESFGDDSNEDEEEKQASAANLERLQRDFYIKKEKLRDDLKGIQEGSEKKNEQE